MAVEVGDITVHVCVPFAHIAMAVEVGDITVQCMCTICLLAMAVEVGDITVQCMCTICPHCHGRRGRGHYCTMYVYHLPTLPWL